MLYRTILSYACISIVFLFGAHIAATLFYWYTSMYGFDKVMHMLGGVTTALLAGALFLKHLRGINPLQVCITLTLFVFVVGLFWEYYEYLVQSVIKGAHLVGLPDSIGDLTFDMIGGAIGSYFVIRIKKRYNRHQ